VIDPFMGSGSTGVAATSLARSFLGNDLSPTALSLAERRLREISQRSTSLSESVSQR
jgi:DNA modification methylase